MGTFVDKYCCESLTLCLFCRNSHPLLFALQEAGCSRRPPWPTPLIQAVASIFLHLPSPHTLSSTHRTRPTDTTSKTPTGLQRSHRRSAMASLHLHLSHRTRPTRQTRAWWFPRRRGHAPSSHTTAACVTRLVLLLNPKCFYWILSASSCPNRLLYCWHFHLGHIGILQYKTSFIQSLAYFKHLVQMKL